MRKKKKTVVECVLHNVLRTEHFCLTYISLNCIFVYEEGGMSILAVLFLL